MQGCGVGLGQRSRSAELERGTEREGALRRATQAVERDLTMEPGQKSVLCTGTCTGLLGVFRKTSTHLGDVEVGMVRKINPILFCRYTPSLLTLLP